MDLILQKMEPIREIVLASRDDKGNEKIDQSKVDKVANIRK